MRIPLGDYELRSFRPEDAASLARHANNRRIAATLRDRFPFPYTLKHAREWIQHATAENPECHFAIVTAEQAIGSIGLELQSDVHVRSAEIGYWVAEEFWGRGIATAAVRGFTAWAFAESDLLRIYAYVFESNPASAKVLEKAGYSLDGRLRCSVVKGGKILDQFLYSVVRD